MITVRFCVVVKKDGLDEEGFVEALNEYGNVFDREDNKLEEEIRMFYVEAPFFKYIRFKLDFICAEPRKYVLFPMASYEDKLKLEKEMM